MQFYPEERWLNWVDTLSDQDFVIIDDFLTQEHYQLLRSYFIAKKEDDDFKKAGIGALGQFQIKTDIRGDFCYWLSQEKDTDVQPFFKLIDELVYILNRFCYLNISDFEFHYAFYPPKAYYEKHVDQFKERNNRQISIVIYLNENWDLSQGGELKIFKDSGEEIMVEPIANRCVLFKSADVPHQVMPTFVDRYSLTGWLLNQPKGIGFL